MRLEEAIADIERCNSMDELQITLQRIIDHYGFAAFTFIDAGQPHLDKPYYVTTTNKAWVNEYTHNDFVRTDPCLIKVRRTNIPFNWGAVELPQVLGRRKPGAVKAMEAARDHGFTEGFVVPYHFRDHRGFLFSSSTVFFWKDTVKRFKLLFGCHRYELQLITIYWTQRAIDLVARDHRHAPPFFRAPDDLVRPALTDRERDVMSWAARGKTIIDTAEILRISEETAETHIRNALRKLNAANKTHGVAKSIALGLIDL
ncbi:MAG: LuxR C-terminal-related transcriptional regulator [Xanthobacteraceae bacterium]